MNSFEEKMPRRVAELHTGLVRRSPCEGGPFKSAKHGDLSAEALAKVDANLPERRSTGRTGGRGLGYGE